MYNPSSLFSTYILGVRHVLTRIVREHCCTNNGIDMENIRDREVVESDRVDDKVGDGAVVTGEVGGRGSRCC